MDHCLSIASCNLSDENHMKKCFNWVNLRPMYPTENNLKGSKNDNRLCLLQQIKAYKFIKLMKKDLTKIFIDEIYSKPSRKNYETNKIIYNHIDEIWSMDLAEMIDYKISNNKLFRYTFIIFDNFSKHLWDIPLKNKFSQTITNEFSNILSTSKRGLSK